MTEENLEEGTEENLEEGTEEKGTEDKKVSISKKETYVPAVSSSGKKSVNNGDEVAAALAGVDIDGMYKIASNFLKDGKDHDKAITEDALREKYGHLNVGMQRMSLGNRIRSACVSEKNAYLEVDDIVVYVDENLDRTSQSKPDPESESESDAA